MYKDILKSLTVSPEKVLSIASAFKSALSNRPDVCGLKLLDSTCTRPAGEEQAEVLALDFGGTNLRLLLIRLKGNRTYGVLKEHIISLKHNRWGIDLTDASIDS